MVSPRSVHVVSRKTRLSISVIATVFEDLSFCCDFFFLLLIRLYAIFRDRERACKSRIPSETKTDVLYNICTNCAAATRVTIFA